MKILKNRSQQLYANMRIKDLVKVAFKESNLMKQEGML